MKNLKLYTISYENGEGAYTKYYNKRIFEFARRYFSFNEIETKSIDTASPFNIENLDSITLNIVNLKRLNDIPSLANFFNVVNAKLPYDGFFVCCVETIKQRKIRLRNKFNSIFFKPYYYIDFIVKRVLPKAALTRKLCHLIAGSNNRVFSIYEVYGRLLAAGFKIIEQEDIENKTYIVAKKNCKPANYTPPSGLAYKMKRIGKDKKIINVYKLRTMYPYAEFLQEYVYEKNGVQKGDKFANDFRVTSWGRFLRKFWLDELPMIINLLKGEIKLVGVRPLSFHKFHLYPKHLQNKRTKFKPGLLPPYYAEMPATFDEFLKVEEKYLDEYEKSPLKTDIKYFWLILKNIFLKGARSA